MKKLSFLVFFIFLIQFMRAQDKKLDSLKQLLTITRQDTNTYNLIRLISGTSLFSYSDSALIYAQKALVLSKVLKDSKREAEAMWLNGYALLVTGDYPLAIDFLLKGLHIEEQIKPMRMNDIFYTPMPMLQLFYYVLSETYKDFGDYEHALFYLNKGRIYRRLNEDDNLMEGLLRVGQIYEKSDQLDSALFYAKKAYVLDVKVNGKSERTPIPIVLGNIYSKKRNYSLALQYYRVAQQTRDFNNTKDVMEVYNGMADVFAQMNETDSAISYAQKALALRKLISYPLGILDTYRILTDIYKKMGKSDSALNYQEKAISLRENLFDQQKEKEVQNLAFNEQLKEKEIIRQIEQYRSKIKLYILSGGLIVLLIIAGLLWRNINHKQKAYTLLQKQKKETDYQKEKVERTLEELKTTQGQLIQSEKMASLGELTAGIAHEIQNPLNFVNNFSEVNKELLVEMKEEMDKGNLDDAKTIANDVIDNHEKINHHGKRADAIVKGMLQHSRASSGQKEFTDINALADEYLRLAYHGLRAKDKSFNAKFETDFDSSLPKINIVPQDIGRVLLNLINNAFYAVSEKQQQNSNGYDPIVVMSTVKNNGKVEIKVKDNGNGIPQKILDKIFQPFFTTKPTGQGTGLGLSLSYDIIKAHGGEIKVETKEGEGAAFIIQLPVKEVL